MIMITETLYIKASDEITRIHNLDSSTEIVNSEIVKSELLYSNRMLSVLELVLPDAGFELKLAAQCQHISRWTIARSTFSMDKKGYYQWRAAVMEHQIGVTRQTLSESGINDEAIYTVIEALKNKANKEHVNASIIEDTACLVFIKWYLEVFASKFEPEKAASILAKTANKMTERGLGLIMKLDVNEGVQNIMQLIA
jgi:hypothetical protein